MGVNRLARLFALTPCVPLSREAGEGETQGAPPFTPTPLFREAGEGETQGAPPFTPTPLSHPVGEGLGVLKRVGFFAGVPARGVAEQGIPASMRARRSRSQHTQRWERGRPARQANYARKNLPF